MAIATGWSPTSDSAITDERIKNVFVGNKSYKQRSSKVRDDKDSYNGLKDLVESHDLIIIRLGVLGTRTSPRLEPSRRR